MPNANLDPATMLDAAQAHAIALAMYNAVEAQQQGAIVRQASATMVCAALLSLGAAETAESTPLPPPAEDASAQQPAPAAAALADKLGKPASPVAAASPAEFDGQVYQSIAQSAALAVQDAADYVRNVSTIAATAAGVAMAQFLANPGTQEQYMKTMLAVEQMMGLAITNFENIGASATLVLKNFPKG